MKLLYLGFNHRPRDPRLFHRQMKLLRENITDCRIYFAKDGHIRRYDDIANLEDSSQLEPENQEPHKNDSDMFLRKVFFWLTHRLTGIIQGIKILKQLRKLRPEIIQASDAREIPFAIISKFIFGSKIIYDAHEDYYRQIVDYAPIGLASFIPAIPLRLYEILFVRIFDVVFCTDDHLFAMYGKRLYNPKKLYLLRNFPLPRKAPLSRTYTTSTKLNLVYIGSINKYRGVIEASSHIKKFNKIHCREKRLTLTIYGPDSSILKDLVNDDIRYGGWVDYDKLMQDISEFDVGVCLWNDIPKFRRNLPLKNFDYMYAGLPIVTSNFGNLKMYAEASKAAICIDPKSYHNFEKAMLSLFDPRLRESLGNAGVNYVKNYASFSQEAAEYLAFVRAQSVALHR